ncbi:MAG: hypothetical protein LKE96_04650 [Acetobacter peroxydans]|jgi:hypothetical protein|nr:hypothetical protein [Acetobacter peroxydans]
MDEGDERTDQKGKVKLKVVQHDTEYAEEYMKRNDSIPLSVEKQVADRHHCKDEKAASEFPNHRPEI